MILAGLALVVLHRVLVAFGVGTFGQPTDIGGGLVVLVGYAVTVAGVVGLWAAARRGRRRP